MRLTGATSTFVVVLSLWGAVATAKTKTSARAKAKPQAASGASSGCTDSDEHALWIAPQQPVAGAPVKLLAVGDEEAAGELAVVQPDGQRQALTVARHAGLPGSLSAELPAGRPGTYRVVWTRGDKTVACRAFDVAAHPPKPGPGAGPVVWPAAHAWDRRHENFFAAWIDLLFDAPPAASVDFRPLHQALRDGARNYLANYLGLREDDPKNKAAIPATPDCADLPYYLRAYFAWKLQLPFGFRDCDRGTDARPPRCSSFETNEQPPSGKDHLAAVRGFLRLVTNHVQSGSARTALGDDETDYYPVALDRKALRPGTIYADPYGHVMMVVKWVAQTPEHGGLLLAVDGQPDTSIGRKRFWEGTFLFTNDTKSAGPGFKAFRPVVRGADGKLASLANASIGGGDDPAHPPYSDEQGKLTADAFYARMGKLINPQGLDAEAAYRETLDALAEQLTVRVGSVDNGEKFQKEKGGVVIPMPDGAKIFETTGPWEDYATPSRDMRLLIAMNVLLGLPDKIVKHPDLFRLGGRKPADVRDQIAKLHAALIPTRGITYTRTDGTPWKLTVADLLARRANLEIAYNPNDCVEVRWGATEGTPEYSPCTRHAPPDQKAKMSDARPWFHDTKRPPR
ncbi:MAG TPA: hypothetical protein VHH90_03900 [Polyangia bacterium]|nr:hypothetical protein [Polyangia bacterium]